MIRKITRNSNVVQVTCDPSLGVARYKWPIHLENVIHWYIEYAPKSPTIILITHDIISEFGIRSVPLFCQFLR